MVFKFKVNIVFHNKFTTSKKQDLSHKVNAGICLANAGICLANAGGV
jgi:hypothetical protein